MCSRLSVFSIITTDWLTNWWTMLVKLLLHLKNGKWINMDTWTPCTSVFNWHNYLWFEAFNSPYDYIIQLNTKNRYTNWKYTMNTYHSVEYYISPIQLKPQKECSIERWFLVYQIFFTVLCKCAFATVPFLAKLYANKSQ